MASDATPPRDGDSDAQVARVRDDDPDRHDGDEALGVDDVLDPPTPPRDGRAEGADGELHWNDLTHGPDALP